MLLAAPLRGTMENLMEKRESSARARLEEPVAEVSRAPRRSQSESAQSSREGRRERHRREIFERMVRVAREILFSKKIDDIRIADITEAADVGKGTFFNYFESKEDVVTGFLDSSPSRNVERIRNSGRPALESLRAAWQEYLCPPTGDWLTYEQNLISALINDNVRSRFAQRYAATAESYEDWMRWGQEEGSVRRDISAKDAGKLAEIYMHGLTVWLWLNGTPPSSELVDAAFSRLEQVLRPQAADPPAPLRARRTPKRRP